MDTLFHPVLLAAAPADPEGIPTYAVMVGLTQLLTLAILAGQWVRSQNGKGAERQVEPTALSALQGEMREQTEVLSAISREIGETRSTLDAMSNQFERLQDVQKSDIENVHSRVGAISRELSGVSARVEILERRPLK